MEKDIALALLERKRRAAIRTILSAYEKDKDIRELVKNVLWDFYRVSKSLVEVLTDGDRKQTSPES